MPSTTAQHDLRAWLINAKSYELSLC